jgi:hypothetical protein
MDCDFDSFMEKMKVKKEPRKFLGMCGFSSDLTEI